MSTKKISSKLSVFFHQMPLPSMTMTRLLEVTSAGRTLFPTRSPSTLATTSVEVPWSPAPGWSLLLTATSRMWFIFIFFTVRAKILRERDSFAQADLRVPLQPHPGASRWAQHCREWGHWAVHQLCQGHPPSQLQQLQPQQRHHADQAEQTRHPQQLRQNRSPALELCQLRNLMPDLWMGKHQRLWKSVQDNLPHLSPTQQFANMLSSSFSLFLRQLPRPSDVSECTHPEWQLLQELLPRSDHIQHVLRWIPWGWQGLLPGTTWQPCTHKWTT